MLLLLLVLPLWLLAAPPKLLIKIPTRDRADQFFQVLDEYYGKLSKKIPYQVVVSCDYDDPVMNCPEIISKLDTYPNLTYYFGENSTKIEACNSDIGKHLDFDILLLASDDMMPIVKNYDLIIAKWMKSRFPDYDGILHFNDGYQGSKLNTLPIMGKKYYDRFGYVYYPGYKSLYCDLEMMQVSRLLGKAFYIPQVIIEHLHPAAGKAKEDSLYEKNNLYSKEDEQLYNAREALNFEIELIR